MENFKEPKLRIVPKNTEAKKQRLERELLPKDRDLRSMLEEEFTSDKKFLELVGEMSAHLQRLSSGREGIEKARVLASFYVLVRQLKKTERSKLSNEFIRLSEEIRRNTSKAGFRRQPEAKKEGVA